MTEKLTVTTERVDDVPLLLSQLKKMQISTLIDQHFPTHGNWQGLSLGSVVVGWLGFILSESNHRLNHVQPWAAPRLTMLQSCLDENLRELDFTDDRLACVLDYLSDDGSWEGFEQEMGQQSLRLYDLPADYVRVDATTTKSYVEVTAEGLFQLGHSKDGRGDVPQVKINLSVLDPLGLPLTTTVVSGEKADDPLYVPEIKRVQAVLADTQGVTYIGDCKMAAVATRAYVAASGDYYVCPLAGVQLPPPQLTALLAVVHDGTQALTEVCAQNAEGDPEKIAEGYEYQVAVVARVARGEFAWNERRVVMRSLKLAQQQQHAVHQRVTAATHQIASLNERKQGKKSFRTHAELRQAVEEIVNKQRVEGLLKISYEEQVSTAEVRKYGARAARVKEKRRVSVEVETDHAALRAATQRLGWRVYATNHPVLTMEQVVQAYRGQYVIEHRIGRLKGRALSLSPLYLSKAERVTGLIRLLSIALRVLTLIEFQVRRKLQQQKSQLSGIYVGNPKRATARPTTEAMLKALGGVTLTKINATGETTIHLTPLTKVQEAIMSLLELPADTYLRLIQHSSKPVFNLSEP